MAPEPSVSTPGLKDDGVKTVFRYQPTTLPAMFQARKS
jgi:hypothetical protein